MPFTIVDDGLNVLQRYDVDSVDLIQNEVPVFMLSTSGHTGYVNTKALREIYNTAKPPGFNTFEEYRKHVNNGGGLQEMEIVQALSSIPQKQLLETILGIWRGLDEIFDLAAKRGVTLLYDASMSTVQKKILDLYCAVSSSKQVRIGYGKLVSSLAEAKETEAWKPVTDVDHM